MEKNSIIEIANDHIEFYREIYMHREERFELPTIDDRNETKLESINKLLIHMYRVYEELASVGIKLQSGSQRDKKYYSLTDKEYKDSYRFEIYIVSDFLDPKLQQALHARFDFCLYIVQDAYRSEIADHLNIGVRHFDTAPFSFASMKNHTRGLEKWTGQPISYFHNIPIKETEVFSLGSYTFKTQNFIEVVDDICLMLDKIIERKEFLEIKEEKEAEGREKYY